MIFDLQNTRIILNFTFSLYIIASCIIAKIFILIIIK